MLRKMRLSLPVVVVLVTVLLDCPACEGGPAVMPTQPTHNDKSFNASIASWRSNNCSFPSPFFYNESAEGTSNSPALSLSKCYSVLPEDPTREPLDQEDGLLYRELCTKFVKLADTLCQDKKKYEKFVLSNLSRDSLLNDVVFTLEQDSCWYASGLPKNPKSYLPGFMLNKTECDRVCSSIFEPVCQLITSALCHFSTWKGCIRPVSSTGAPAATSPTEGPHTEPGSTVVASESPAKTQEPTQAAGDTGGAGKAGTNGASGNTGTNGAADITDKPGQGVTKRPEVGKPSQRVTASPGQTAASTKSLNGAGGVTPALSGMTEKVDGQTLGPGQSTPEKMSGAEPTVPTRTSAGTPVLGGGAGGTGGGAGGDGGKIETPIPAVATEKPAIPEGNKPQDLPTDSNEENKPKNVEIPGAKATGQGEGGGQQTAGTSTEGTTKDAGNGDGSPGEDNTPQAGAGDKAGDDKKVGGLPEVVAGGDGDHVKVVGAGGDGGAEEIADGGAEEIGGGDSAGTVLDNDGSTETKVSDPGAGPEPLDGLPESATNAPTQHEGQRQGDPLPNSNGQNYGVHPPVLSDPDSPGSGHFFAYFLTAVVICISGYVIFHNKQKIVAFIVEGRHGTGGSRRRSGGPKYSQLKSNVEEVMPSLESATTVKNFVY